MNVEKMRRQIDRAQWDSRPVPSSLEPLHQLVAEFGRSINQAVSISFPPTRRGDSPVV